jgi:ABC-2 type transport system permease protein
MSRTAEHAASSRPVAATSRGSLLASELDRLRHRRLVTALMLLGLVALLVAMAAVFATHSTDVEGAHTTARQLAERATQEQRVYAQQCLDDPGIPQSEKAGGACDFGTVTEDAFFNDPRFRADQGLPMLAIGVGVGGALLASLLAATATGADWSSRSIITLLSWHPRRVRFFGTRLLAICLYVAAIGVVAQALALGLGAMTVRLRGTWEATPRPDPNTGPDGGGMLFGDHLWSQLLSLQLRTVAVMVLVSVMATALATVFRSTGGVLGVAFGWFAVVEVAVHALLGQRQVVRYMLTDNLAAALLPGGTDLYLGQQVTPEGVTAGVVHLSNAMGLGYLAVVALALCCLAVVLLRRRDL